LITKMPVGIKAKQMINMTIAARLRAPKISSRSHRLTIGKSQPRIEPLSKQEPGYGRAGSCKPDEHERDAGTCSLSQMTDDPVVSR